MKAREEYLQNAVFTLLLKQADNILKCDGQQTDQAQAHSNLSEIEQRIAECQAEKQRLYEMLVSEVISIDEFKRLKKNSNYDLKHYKQQLKISQETAVKNNQHNTTLKGLLQTAKGIKREITLTQELADTLVERVYVFPDNSIKVDWKIAGFDAIS